MAGGAVAAALLARQQILSGQSNVIVFGNVTVTFPSAKFCKKYVDDEILTKVQSIAGGPVGVVGGVKIGGVRVCHEHVRGNTGVAYVWTNPTNLSVVATGEKSGRAPKDAGGYDWTTG